MNDEARDEALQREGIKFLPWVGAHYKQGFRGCRLLILGESHYDEWDGQRHDLDSEFTRDCVREVVQREDKAASFWKTLEQTLLNEQRVGGWAPSGGKALWERLAFYNYLQTAVSGAARAPRPRERYQAVFQEAQRPFRAVLEQLRPERVLVCGKGLWEGMEQIPEEDNYISEDVQAYNLAGGQQVWCFATVHPSSGRYSWIRLHSYITAFLDNPRRLAATD